MVATLVSEQGLLRRSSFSTNFTLVNKHVCEVFRLHVVPHIRLGLMLEYRT